MTQSHLVADSIAALDSGIPERQRNELIRILDRDDAGQSLQLLNDAGVLDRLLPEVAAGRGVEQPKEHHWDVLGHALMTVDILDTLLAEAAPDDSGKAVLWQALWREVGWYPGIREHFRETIGPGHSRRALLKLGGLLHDVAKPQTKTRDKTGRIRFFGHAELGAEIAEMMLCRLHFSSEEVELIATMVREHLRTGQMVQSGLPTRRAINRYFRATGAAAIDVLFLNLADHAAARGPNLTLEDWQIHVAYVGYILREHYTGETATAPARLLTGHDIMAELGLEPGPQIGWLLAQIEEARAAGRVASREEALRLARNLHSRDAA